MSDVVLKPACVPYLKVWEDKKIEGNRGNKRGVYRNLLK
jgi:hypothetical protein